MTKMFTDLDTSSIDREHAAILQAISQRDPDGAARLTIYHAQSTRDRWADLFAETAERERE